MKFDVKSTEGSTVYIYSMETTNDKRVEAEKKKHSLEQKWKEKKKQKWKTSSSAEKYLNKTNRKPKQHKHFLAIAAVDAVATPYLTFSAKLKRILNDQTQKQKRIYTFALDKIHSKS